MVGGVTTGQIGGKSGGSGEGSSLKKHYVSEECAHGAVFRGPRLQQRKRVLLQ